MLMGAQNSVGASNLGGYNGSGFGIETNTGSVDGADASRWAQQMLNGAEAAAATGQSTANPNDNVSTPPVYYPGTTTPIPATIQAAVADATNFPAAWGDCTASTSLCGTVIAQAGTPTTEAAANTGGVTFSPTLASEAATSPGDTASQQGQLQIGFLGQIAQTLKDILAGILDLPATIWKAFEDEVGKLFAPNLVNAQTQFTAVQTAFATKAPFSIFGFVSSFLGSITIPSGACHLPAMSFRLVGPFGAVTDTPVDWTPIVCPMAAVIRPLATWGLGIDLAWHVLRLMFPRMAL